MDRIDRTTDWRWLSAGIAVTSLLAVADVGRTWYWFPAVIPVHIAVYAAAIGAVYTSWVGIGFLVGRLRREVRARVAGRRTAFAIHAAASIAVGALHLLFDALVVKALFAGQRPLLSLGTLYVEKLVAWLPYEILAYWGCLAAYALVDLQRQRGRDANLGAGRCQRRFVVRHGEEEHVVSCDRVLWIEALDNYVVLQTGTARHVVHDTMARLERVLDPQHFLRIHRSYIVNLDRIDGLPRDDGGSLQLRMATGTVLPVGRRRRAALKRALTGRR